MKPQLIKCSHHDYNNRPDLKKYMRSNDLKLFIESPQKYEDYRIKNLYPEKQSDPMRRGEVLHMFSIEGKSKRGEDYELWERKRTGKDWEAFEAECNERGIPYLIRSGKTDELKLIQMQCNAILRNKKAVSLMKETAVREQTILFEYKGLKCKVRLDMLSAEGAIIDLKSDSDPTQKKFFRKMHDLGYHYSAVFYEMARDAYWQSNRVYPFHWIVVSNTGWIYCKVYELDDPVRDIARMHVKAKLDHFIHCKETGAWDDPELNKSHILFASDYYLQENGCDLIQE